MAYTYTYQPQPRTFSAFPPVVKILLIANIAIFAVQYLLPQVGNMLMNHFALWPLTNQVIDQFGQRHNIRPPFQVWQVLTYGFMHGGIGHLFFNMFALWMFGSVIEKVWGSKRFLFYYLVCIAGAAAAQLIVTYGVLKAYPTVGASGGVFGLLLAFGMMFPRQPIYFIFLPVPIPAKWFVIGYGAIELFFGVTGTLSGIAHFAHLGGMVGGYLLIQYWLGKLPWKPPPGKLF